MKSGASDDPLAEEPPKDEDGGDRDHREERSVATSDPDGGPRRSSRGSTPASSDPPYVLRRNTVKEDRDMVQFFLREQFIDGERDLRRAVEKILETDVKKTDLREAAYAFAQEHPEEVAEILLEWGYEYR